MHGERCVQAGALGDARIESQGCAGEGETGAASKAQADMLGHTGAGPAWSMQANTSRSEAHTQETHQQARSYRQNRRVQKRPNKGKCRRQRPDTQTELIKTSGSANNERY